MPSISTAGERNPSRSRPRQPGASCGSIPTSVHASPRGSPSSSVTRPSSRAPTLTPIQDTNHRVLPAGCHLEQLANQHEPEVPNDKRYLVSADLWARLDPAGRAGLVLHKDHARRRRPWPGRLRAGRVLTALVSSKQLDAMTPSQFEDVLAELGFHAEHWADPRTGFDWMLVSWAPTTFAGASASCKTLTRGYRLPNVRELLGSFRGPAAFAAVLVDRRKPTAEGRGAVDVERLRPRSRRTRARPCAADDAVVKGFYFFSTGEPADVVPACQSRLGPKALCVATRP